MNLTHFIRALHIPHTVIYGRFASRGIWTYPTEVDRARSLFCITCLFCLIFFAAPAVAQGDDQFISAISKIKTSIAAIACVNPAQQISVHGTAFFVENNGTFLTAGHVVKEFLPSGQLYGCLRAAVYVPTDNWQQENLSVTWMQFLPEQCIFDGLVDVAKCRTVENPMMNNNIHIKPTSVIWEETTQSDGAAVAFTGFPLSAVIPYTSRANIVAYPLPAKPGATHIILDKTAWPGASGSPVYIWSGRVIGLIIQRGEGAAAGLAVALRRSSHRPILAHRAATLS